MTSLAHTGAAGAAQKAPPRHSSSEPSQRSARPLTWQHALPHVVERLLDVGRKEVKVEALGVTGVEWLEAEVLPPHA